MVASSKVPPRARKKDEELPRRRKKKRMPSGDAEDLSDESCVSGQQRSGLGLGLLFFLNP